MKFVAYKNVFRCILCIIITCSITAGRNNTFNTLTHSSREQNKSIARRAVLLLLFLLGVGGGKKCLVIVEIWFPFFSCEQQNLIAYVFFREQQLLVVPTFVLCDVRLDHEELFSSPSHSSTRLLIPSVQFKRERERAKKNLFLIIIL